MSVRRRFVKLERGIVPKAQFDRVVPAHIAYVKRLQRQGRLAESGYWAGYGGGMMVFEASSVKEARAIVAQDPLVAHRLVTYELKEWKLVAPMPTRGQTPKGKLSV